MASVNKVILIGNVGKDPDTRNMQNGDAVTNLTLATTESWKDKDGVKKENTEWHRITFYRKLAEIVGQYCKKGQSLYVEGRLETRKWADKDGVERYTTEVVANAMQMLGGKQAGSSSEPAKAATRPETPKVQAPKSNGGFDDMDDDIPF